MENISECREEVCNFVFKSRPKDSLYRRPIIEANRHTSSETVMSVGTGATIQTNRYVRWERVQLFKRIVMSVGNGCNYSNETLCPFLLFIFNYMFGLTSVHSALP